MHGINEMSDILWAALGVSLDDVMHEHLYHQEKRTVSATQCWSVSCLKTYGEAKKGTFVKAPVFSKYLQKAKTLEHVRTA